MKIIGISGGNKKCAAGIFHTIMDRFGPRMGLSNNIVADKISAANGGRRIDSHI